MVSVNLKLLRLVISKKKSMSKIYKAVLLFLLIGSSCTTVFSQNALALKERIGDKYFVQMSYIQAIATYESIMKDDTTIVSCLPNLAESYRKINDMGTAEGAFAKLVKIYPNDSNYLLSYAQILAINGKLKESQSYYEKLATICPNDSRYKAFADAYANGSLENMTTNNIINIANFNTSQSDFGPIYYKSGLVFASSRRVSSVIQRSFNWDLSSFLDLYYIKDTGDIKMAPKIDTVQGKSKRRKIVYNDDDTRTTSNDTKTMAGYLSQKYIDTSGMFVTAPFLIEGLSSAINSKYHEGPAVFTKDQNTIYFTRNNYYKWHAKKSKEGINKLELFSATFNDKKWGNVKPLNMNSNNYSVGHPALSKDDSTMYFTSDMPGGIGGTDLYKCKMNEKGEWSKPENMGRPINTEGNEMFPYVDAEGTFYFSSNGHPGFGGLDIFKTNLDNPTIINLGKPINSTYDDFSIALDNTTKEGYISSNRRRGFNDDDIYIITIPKPSKFIIRVVDSVTNELIPLSKINVKPIEGMEAVKVDTSSTGNFVAYMWNEKSYQIGATAETYIPNGLEVKTDLQNPVITIRLRKMLTGCIVAGIITDKDSKLPIDGARIVIYDKTANDTIYNYNVSETGKYRYVSLKSNHLYFMDVSKEGYFNKPYIELNTSDNKCLSAVERAYDYLRDFELEKIIVGRAIKIENIYFDLAKYNIRKSAAVELDKIVKLMQENPDIVIELSSHTDCRASFQYNMTLSDNRAKASANYIISKGISTQRIVGKGYGETKLVNDCECEGTKISRPCTEEEHQANRRTEFQVTGFLSDKNTKILNDGKGSIPKSVPVPQE